MDCLAVLRLSAYPFKKFDTFQLKGFWKILKMQAASVSSGDYSAANVIYIQDGN